MVQKQGNNDDFSMFTEEDKSSGSYHSTSKPMPQKKKKLDFTRKEFLELKGIINQVFAIHTSSQPPHNLTLATLQSLEERRPAIETKEKFMAERVLLRVEMGIHRLYVQRQSDHQKFFKMAEEILKEVKDQFVKVTINQEDETKFLINETHNTYKPRYS